MRVVGGGESRNLPPKWLLITLVRETREESDVGTCLSSHAANGSSEKLHEDKELTSPFHTKTAAFINCLFYNQLLL